MDTNSSMRCIHISSGSVNGFHELDNGVRFSRGGWVLGSRHKRSPPSAANAC